MRIKGELSELRLIFSSEVPASHLFFQGEKERGCRGTELWLLTDSTGRLDRRGLTYWAQGGQKRGVGNW